LFYTRKKKGGREEIKKKRIPKNEIVFKLEKIED